MKYTLILLLVSCSSYEPPKHKPIEEKLRKQDERMTQIRYDLERSYERHW